MCWGSRVSNTFFAPGRHPALFTLVTAKVVVCRYMHNLEPSFLPNRGNKTGAEGTLSTRGANFGPSCV